MTNLLQWSLAICSAATSLMAMITTALAASGDPLPQSQLEFELPFAAERIYAAGGGNILAVEKGGRALVHVDATDGPGEVRTLDLSIGFVSPVPGEEAAFVAILEDPSTTEPRLVTIVRVNNGVLTIENLPQGLMLPQPSLPAVAGDSRGRVLVWDRTVPADYPFVLVYERGEILKTKLHDHPQAIILWDSEPLLIGLQFDFEQVSIANFVRGWTEDRISVEGLQARTTDHVAIFSSHTSRSSAKSIAVVTPATSDALLVLTASYSRAGPRIGVPLRIGLEGAAEQGQRPFVAADSELTTILVGSEGKESLGVFRLAGGALERAGNAFLGSPIQDLAVLDGDLWDVFALLLDDGRRLVLAPSLAPFLQLPANTSAITRVDELPQFDPNDLLHVQRTLGALNYSIGAVDGILGRQTEAAIRAFQFDEGLEATGRVDSPTADALRAALATVRREGEQYDFYRSSFSEFVSSAELQDPDRLLELGLPHVDPQSPCFGQNDLPPRDYWPNALELGRLLAALEAELSDRVRIVSGYRTLQFNRCLAGPPNSAFLQFRALEIAPARSDLDLSEINTAARRAAGADIADRIVTPLKDSILIEVPDTGTIRRRVYVHFAGDVDRETVIGLSRSLLAEGWTVEGAHRGGERIASAAGLNEVRYFHAEDRNSAEQLASRLAAFHVVPDTVGVKDLSASRLASKSPKGNLEAWIGVWQE